MKHLTFTILFIFSILILSVYVVVKFPIFLGLDLQGGVRVVLEAKDTPLRKVDQDAVLGAIQIIRQRVDSLGVSEPVIQRKGFKQIIVELPGVRDSEHAISMIGQTALLEFVEAEWAPIDVGSLSADKLALLAGDDARLSEVIQYDDLGRVQRRIPIFLKKTVMTGAALKTAYAGTNQYGQPSVDIEFTSEGSKLFHAVTQENVGKPLAILLDGKVISAPNIRQAIAGGRAQIEGGFTVREMRDLVIQLKAGALPVPVEILSDKIVGPSLGADSLQKSKVAGIVGIALLVVYMVLSYRVFGFVACLSLVYYLLLVVAVFKLFQATLTLPGIAGLILTLGMAVDANIIIFERIKEEFRLKKSLAKAISDGFSKAFVAILDANITTLVAAAVLFFLGTGSIKGFAVFLSIGILSSMFTALVVSKWLIELYLQLFRGRTLFQVKG
ncbi:MAG: protein translocase subunit SecD [bacterium]